MSDNIEYQIPPELQPEPDDVSYDLDHALNAMVSLRAEIPDDAFTASILGTERSGHGVLIDERGIIVTIGYLVTEASQVWVVSNRGQAVPGHVLGYDYETGFGLVQTLGSLDAPFMPLGDSDKLEIADPMIVAGYGGASESVKVNLAARKEFAGYWEYVLDEALFTSPPHPNWGGTALIGPDGDLCGIGSLYIDQIVDSLPDVDGNMMVPVNLLKPILDELSNYGRTLKPARPWLGMFVSEVEQTMVVAGVYEGAPAAQADIRAGDFVLEVAGSGVSDLATMFRSVWSCGPAGIDIPLTIKRDGEILNIQIPSVDRREFWKTPALH